MHSALQAWLQVDDTQAYIRMDCKGGSLVPAPGVHVCDAVPLVTVDLNQQPKPFKCSPHINVAIRPVGEKRFLIKTKQEPKHN